MNRKDKEGQWQEDSLEKFWLAIPLLFPWEIVISGAILNGYNVAAYRTSSDIIHSGLQNLNLEHFTHNTSVVFAASQFNWCMTE